MFLLTLSLLHSRWFTYFWGPVKIMGVPVNFAICWFLCVCVCVPHSYPCWCLHFVLASVKLLITFSISMYIMCNIMFVQCFEPRGRSFTNFHRYYKRKKVEVTCGPAPPPSAVAGSQPDTLLKPAQLSWVQHWADKLHGFLIFQREHLATHIPAIITGSFPVLLMVDKQVAGSIVHFGKVWAAQHYIRAPFCGCTWKRSE